MLLSINGDKNAEVFVQIDDFTQLFDDEIRQLRLESSKSRNRKNKLSDSEIMRFLFTFI